MTKGTKKKVSEPTVSVRMRGRAHKKLRIRAAKEGKTLLDLFDELANA